MGSITCIDKVKARVFSRTSSASDLLIELSNPEMRASADMSGTGSFYPSILHLPKRRSVTACTILFLCPKRLNNK